MLIFEKWLSIVGYLSYDLGDRGMDTSAPATSAPTTSAPSAPFRKDTSVPSEKTLRPLAKDTSAPRKRHFGPS